MKGAMVAYNPCCKCENKKMCQMCEITYYRHILESDIALPLILCNECTHYTPVEGGKPLCALHSIAVAHDDFCSYGERRGKDAVD